jgi:predicted secreted protein
MEPLRRLAERLRGRLDFRDPRGRRVVLVAHCVLSQNARVAGAAECPAAVVELVTGLLERDIGIVQMPCPELCAFGLDRARVCIESELRTGAGRLLCRDLVRRIRTCRDCRVQVLGVLGKNGSPSCGVEATWAGGVVAGPGAFVEELAAEFREQGLALDIRGVRDREPAAALAAMDGWLAGVTRT